MIAKVKGPGGKLVLGTEATDEDGGVYIKNVTITRADPFAGAARGVESSIVDWYQDVWGKEGARPLAAVIQAEVGGPPYKIDGQKKEASTAPAEALKQALSFSSKVFLKDGTKLVGFIGRSEEDKAAGRISFFSAPGAEPKPIEMKDVDRLAWLRRVILGTGWEEEDRRVTSRRPEPGPDDTPGEQRTIYMREYQKITLGLVYDDGSTELKGEAEAAPR
jgi:hypothetical protein